MAKKKVQAEKLAAAQQSWTDQSQQTASAAPAKSEATTAQPAQAAPEGEKRKRTSFNVKPSHLQVLYDLQAKLARTQKRPSMSDLIDEAIKDLGKKHGVGE